MPNTQKVGYIRVSTTEQNDERQRKAMQDHGIDRFFVDHASGKDANRDGLKELLEYIRQGDVIFVTEFSRLGRSTSDLLNIVKEIEGKGASLISMKENFDTSTPSGRLQMTMLAAISQFEREMILERQREGIEIAKRNGKYKGRKPVSVPNIEEYYQSYMRRERTKTEIAKELQISRTTLNKLFREHCNS